MRKHRINLSKMTGMNLLDVAHSGTELVKCVNVEPTDNGLEMRNGAKELSDDFEPYTISARTTFSSTWSHNNCIKTLPTGDFIIAWCDAANNLYLTKIDKNTLSPKKQITVTTGVSYVNIDVDSSGNIYIVYTAANKYIIKYTSELVLSVAAIQLSTYILSVGIDIVAMPNGNIAIVWVGAVALGYTIYNAALSSALYTGTFTGASANYVYITCDSSNILYVGQWANLFIRKADGTEKVAGIVTHNLSGAYERTSVAKYKTNMILYSYGNEYDNYVKIYDAIGTLIATISAAGIYGTTVKSIEIKNNKIAMIYRYDRSILTKYIVRVYNSAYTLEQSYVVDNTDMTTILDDISLTTNSDKEFIFSYKGYIQKQVFNPYTMIESGDEMLTDTGEYLYHDADEITKSGNFLFGSAVDRVWETNVNNAVAINKAGKNYIGTLHAPFSVLFKKQKPGGGEYLNVDADQDAVLFEYNPDLKSITQVMLAQRENAEGTNTYLNKYTIIEPIYAEYKTNSIIQIGEGKASAGSFAKVSDIQAFTTVNGYYNGGKALAYTSFGTTNILNAKCKGEHWAYGTGASTYLANKTTPANSINTGATVASAIVKTDSLAISSTQDLVFVLAGNILTIFLYDSGATPKYVALTGTIAMTTIRDFEILYYSGTSYSALILTDTQLIQVYFTIDSATAPTAVTYSANNNVILANGIDYDVVSTKTYNLNVNTVWSAPIYITLLDRSTNTISVNFANFSWATGTNAAVQNFEEKFKLTKEDFPFVQGTMQDIACAPTSPLYEMNKPLPVGIIPFYGYLKDTDATVQPTMDLYSLPIQDNYENPINIYDTHQLFSPMATAALRWKQWLFYIIPPPITEAQVQNIKLCAGYLQADGKYKFGAWSEEGSDDTGFIDKKIPAIWSPDNVLLYRANMTQSVDEFLTYDPFLAGNKNGASTTIAKTVIETVGGGLITKSGHGIVFHGVLAEDPYITTPLQFKLKKGKKYILSFAALETTAVTPTLQVLVYDKDTCSENPAKMSLNWTTAALSTSWQTFTSAEFSVNNYVETEESSFAIRFDIASGATATVKITDLKFYESNDGLRDSFLADSAYVTSEQDKFNMVGFTAGYYNAIIDSLKSIAFFTQSGIIYQNKSTAHYLNSTPVLIAETGFGYVVTCKNDTWLLSGLTIPMPIIKILNDGIPTTEKYAVAGCKTFACLYNNRSVYLIESGGVTDIGARIEAYVSGYTGTKYVGIDESQGLIYIPIDIQALETITDGTHTLTTGFAIFDMAKRGWRIFAYCGTIESTGFVKYSRLFEYVIGDTGGRLCILELNELESRTAGFLNETWDYLITAIQTREMSLDNADYYKKIERMAVDAMSRRRNDIANPTYCNVKFYTNIDVWHPSTGLVMELLLDKFEQVAWETSVGVNLPSTSIEIIESRPADTKNPKIIFKDIFLDVEDTDRPRRGGWGGE